MAGLLPTLILPYVPVIKCEAPVPIEVIKTFPLKIRSWMLRAWNAVGHVSSCTGAIFVHLIVLGFHLYG
jgi:hypothetical protein